MPVFDQGYQHWSGTLSGHAWRWLTIARHGVRAGMKSIFLRLVVITSWVPAVFLAFVLCLWGLVEQNSSLIAPIRPYLMAMFPEEMLTNARDFRLAIWTISFDIFLWIEIYASMLVVLLVGPGLISQDLRFNALPLYFSRPLRRIDYFVGKLGVIAWFLGLVVVFPSLIAYGLGLLFSLDVTILWDTFPLLLACLGYGGIVVLSAGTLVLALSSLSRSSRYIGLFWIAMWFISTAVGTALNLVDVKQRELEHRQKFMEAFSPSQQGRRPLTREEQVAEQRAQEERMRNVQKEIVADDVRAAQTNWRWLPSYTGNLSRVGDKLLNYDAAWRKFSLLLPEEEREQFLYVLSGSQYPWYWSAGVLAVLFGLSVCMLNYRVRSLDRLK